jgi:hypothetical protein
LREVRVSRLKFSLAIEFALFLVKCRDRIPVNHASYARHQPLAEYYCHCSYT